MKMVYGSPDSICLPVTVPKGTPPNAPETPKVLKVEAIVPYWGLFRSMELGVFRDGCRAKDLVTTNIGVEERAADQSLVLAFQIHDGSCNTVADHEYRLEATVSFFA